MGWLGHALKKAAKIAAPIVGTALGSPALGAAIGGLVSGASGSKAAKKAADAQTASMDAAIAEQRRQFDVTQANQLPWMDAGKTALTQLQNPQDYFKADPGYNFARDEALRAVQHSAAARGGLFSGNTGRALEARATDLADQTYNNWWNRTAGVAGVGQAATNALGTFGANTANNVGNLLVGQGDARASGIAGSANAWNSALGTITGAAGDAFSNWWNNRGLSPVKVTAKKIGGI